MTIFYCSSQLGHVVKACMLLVAVACISGCMGHITLNIQSPGLAGEPQLARVKVNDLRAPGIAASKRDAAIGVPMGNIDFSPTEAALVKGVVEAELTKYLVSQNNVRARDYSCDLLEFGVNTNTTPLYWEVIARVKIVLRSGEKETELLATSTGLTYIWPGESFLTEVVSHSLEQLADKVRGAAPGV